MERYLALSRVTSGEVMARVFAELRRPAARAGGALVWFLTDLWPGAGWGILDARGAPKSPYWFLRRLLQPTALLVTDEGVNGLHLHVVNDRSSDLEARLRFELFRDGEVRVALGETDVRVEGRGASTIPADRILPTFVDSARAYRFGPPGHDLAVATLLDAAGGTLAEAIHLHDFGAPPSCAGLEAQLAREEREDGCLVVKLHARRFAHAVTIAVPGFAPEDNYFDLRPGAVRSIALREVPGTKPRAPSGALSALNLRAPIPLHLRGVGA
jgi:beta-mannosidase